MAFCRSRLLDLPKGNSFFVSQTQTSWQSFFHKCPVVDHCCLTQVFFHPKTTHQLVAILSTSAHLSITGARQLSKGKLSSFPRPTGQLAVIFSTGVPLSIIAAWRKEDDPWHRQDLLCLARHPPIHWFLHQRKRHKIDLSCLTGPAVGRPVQRQFHSSFPRPTDQVAVIFQQESRCRSRSRGQPTMSSNASVVPHSFTGGELRCSVGFALIHKRGGPVPLNWSQNTSENSSGTLHAIQSCPCPF